MRTIDLNCDVGEGAGHDAELMPNITSANIACGAHAGDRATMLATIALARQHRVAIGAHPGFADRANFGRVERAITPAEVGRIVLAQVEELFELAGSALAHVKLHGALYHQVSRDLPLAEAVAGELSRRWPRLVVFALAGSCLARAARDHGLTVAEEVFADRTYEPVGSLTPRSQPGAVINDPNVAVAQAVRLAREGRVRARTGSDITLQADTICLHGDGAAAVEFARHVRAALQAAGIRVRAVSASERPA